MAYINDNVFDNGLTIVDTGGTRVDICSQEPTNYTEATSTYTRGNETAINTGAPEAGSPSGRRVRVPAISDGDVTDTGTVSHWALTNATDTLYATGSISGTPSVTNGNKFTLTALDITILDATSV